MIYELLNKLNKSLKYMNLEGKMENLVVLSVENKGKNYTLKKELFLDFPLQNLVSVIGVFSKEELKKHLLTHFKNNSKKG
tara:strand:- start:349 stop:588 length:240 start_codon:yes stop_codon:yes gene_type:complete